MQLPEDADLLLKGRVRIVKSGALYQASLYFMTDILTQCLEAPNRCCRGLAPRGLRWPDREAREPCRNRPRQATLHRLDDVPHA